MQKSTVEQQPIEEDEIDLRELWQMIWSNRGFILLFTSAVTFFTIIYILSTPNIYSVKSILVPVEKQKSSSLGGLGGLAAMAGISVGGGEVGPMEAFNVLLSDYGTMREFILENSLHKDVMSPSSEDYRFAFGFRALFNLFHLGDELEASSEDSQKKIFNTYKALKGMVDISEDKKSGIITFSVENADRQLAKRVLELVLISGSRYLIANDIKEIDSQLKYYNDAFAKANDITVRTQLGTQASALMHNKITLQSSPYYKLKKLTEPTIPYHEDKSKPKRSLILIVSIVTSIILAVFILFFREFLKNSRE